MHCTNKHLWTKSHQKYSSFESLKYFKKMTTSKYNEIRKYKIEKFHKMIEVIVTENNMLER